MAAVSVVEWRRSHWFSMTKYRIMVNNPTTTVPCVSIEWKTKNKMPKNLKFKCSRANRPERSQIYIAVLLVYPWYTFSRNNNSILRKIKMFSRFLVEKFGRQ